MKQYLIIGNGVASAGCIEGIRSVDRSGRITVISEESHPVYCRPLISYYLQGKTTAEHMDYRRPDFYDVNDCTVLYGRKAVSVDPAGKTVTLDNGEKITYTALCDAAGSSPFVPPFEGLDTVKKQTGFMTLDDALYLEENVTPDSRVLIVGAGLIGLKCAEGLYGRAKEITVCDLADRVLSSILDNECAALMQQAMEKAGIRFLLSDTAVSFDKNTAHMKSGKTVDFDILVLAVGVRANTGIIKDAGGNVNRGIIVNNRMETSVKSIYAAGDCTESLDVSSGKDKVMAIFPNAYMQGHTAGINMAGGDDVFDRAIPMNSIGFFGLHAMSAGTSEGEMYEEKKDDSIRRFFTDQGLLKGYMLIGSLESAGIYTAMIREKTPLDSVDFDKLLKKASYEAFPAEKRRKKFGGVV